MFLLHHFVTWRRRRVGVGGAFLCCTGCLPSRRGRVFRVFVILLRSALGAGFVADVVWGEVSGVVSYLGLSVAVRNQGESR